MWTDWVQSLPPDVDSTGTVRTFGALRALKRGFKV